VVLTRALENVDENHDTSFEPHFALRLAVCLDMLLFRRFCLLSLVFGYYSGECRFLSSHSLVCGNIFS